MFTMADLEKAILTMVPIPKMIEQEKVSSTSHYSTKKMGLPLFLYICLHSTTVSFLDDPPSSTSPKEEISAYV